MPNCLLWKRTLILQVEQWVVEKKKKNHVHIANILWNTLIHFLAKSHMRRLILLSCLHDKYEAAASSRETASLALSKGKKHLWNSPINELYHLLFQKPNCKINKFWFYKLWRVMCLTVSYSGTVTSWSLVMNMRLAASRDSRTEPG